MSETPQPAKRRNWLALAPLVAFLALAGLFLSQLLAERDVNEVPSALIGQQAPKTELPPLLASGKGLANADFAGQVTLLNVFASWCVPCRQEHPVLIDIARDARIRVAGLNYKDKPDNAKAFLSELGDPYAAIGADESGRTAIDWGVYGVPESYVIGKDGTILAKHVGPITPESFAARLKPVIDKALGE